MASSIQTTPMEEFFDLPFSDQMKWQAHYGETCMIAACCCSVCGFRMPKPAEGGLISGGGPCTFCCCKQYQLCGLTDCHKKLWKGPYCCNMTCCDCSYEQEGATFTSPGQCTSNWLCCECSAQVMSCCCFTCVNNCFCGHPASGFPCEADAHLCCISGKCKFPCSASDDGNDLPCVLGLCTIFCIGKPENKTTA